MYLLSVCLSVYLSVSPKIISVLIYSLCVQGLYILYLYCLSVCLSLTKDYKCNYTLFYRPNINVLADFVNVFILSLSLVWLCNITLQCHHQNDSSLLMGSDECHFTVSLTVRVTKSSQDSVHLKRRENRSRIEPRSFCFPA